MTFAIDETWYVRPPHVAEHLAAGGVIARLEGDRVYVALVREGAFTDYILPKGHVEEGETPEETARREIAEESGLTDLVLLGELGVRERLDFAKKGWKKTHYFLFTTRQKEGIPTDRARAYRLEWFPLDALPSMFWPEQRALVEENRERIRRALAQGS
jgi:ADP-ribose pyrophosphatase YjhB (NUDIX family)